MNGFDGACKAVKNPRKKTCGETGAIGIGGVARGTRRPLESMKIQQMCAR